MGRTRLIVAIGTHQLGVHHERDGIYDLSSARPGPRCVSRAYSFVVTFGLRSLTRRLLLCGDAVAAAGVSLVGGFGVGIADRVRRSCSMGPQPVLALSLRPSWGGTAD